MVTLIANPVKEPLSQAFVDGFGPSLALHGVSVAKSFWLEPGVAADVFVDFPDVKVLDGFVQAIMADQPYDAVVQRADNRVKQMLISDMDSTMITVECIDELADFVGMKAEVSVITERAMNGELNFEAALTERVALLKDLPQGMLRQCYEERVKLMPGAKELVATMRKFGAQAVLVSGGFTFFTGRVRDALGFHEDYANLLEIEHGLLTGRVIPPILGKEAKLKTLQDYCKKLGIGTDDVMAVGDGANDLPMLLAAGMGVAYHAKPVVRAQAGARITQCDLSALLYVQGFARADWAHVAA